MADCLVGLLVAHHVGDPGAEGGVGAVVGVLQRKGLGVSGPAPLPSALLYTTQQLPPSRLLQRHLKSKKLTNLPSAMPSIQFKDRF
jgi:hypothetical protein